MPWLGRKYIAFIPLHRPNAHPPDDPIPADWPAEILRRVYYDPNAFPNLPDRSLRTYIHRVVYFRSSDGGLHEIWWVPGTTPAWGNLTEAYGAPPAADRPTAFTVEGPSTQHVAFRTTANHIDELIW